MPVHLTRTMLTAAVILMVSSAALAAGDDTVVQVDLPLAMRVDGTKIFLNLNIPVLRRVVLEAEDIRGASVMLKLKAAASGDVALYRTNEARPLAAIAVPPGHKDALEFPGIEGFLRDCLTGRGDGSLVVSMTAPLKIDLKNSVLRVSIRSYPKHQLFDSGVRLRDRVYVENRGGHLYYGGERLRLWGAVLPQRPNTELIDRVHKMGFNAIRMWGPRAKNLSAQGLYDAASSREGRFAAVRQGDGSPLDEYDRFLATAKRHGLFIMSTGLMGAAPLGADAEWLRGNGADWDRWRAAIAHKPAEEWVAQFFAAFDERVFKARERQIENYLTHVNPYTGKRYAEEETIAIFELANENSHVKRILEKGFDKWPAFFVAELQGRWNQWLRERYRDDAGIKRAWSKLGDGETLASVKLAPLAKDRGGSPERRANDLMRFLLGLEIGMNRRLEAYARSFAPKGVGVAVAPFSYDTQYQPSVSWLYGDTQGQVANFGMYFWQLTSALTAPPGMYVMDSSTVQGKISVIYETMAGRPNPFRAEYPLKLAALASWQDWDAIFFHYWMGLNNKERTFPDEAYLAAPMTYVSPSHYWTSVYYEMDPALLSPMALAGRIFINGAIRPAAEPVTYAVGGKSIFSFQGLGGPSMARAAFSRGARIRFDPGGDYDVKIEGAAPGAFDAPPSGAVVMGGEVLWDWPNGRLIIDTPTAKAYVGVPCGKYRFKDGIVAGLSGGFVSFAMISADGKPFTATRQIILSAAADARNTGFQIDLADAPPHGGSVAPLAAGKRILNNGTAPVVVDRVPYRIWFPQEISGRLEGYDFALRRCSDQPVSGGVVEHDGSERFVSVLRVDHRGGTLATPPGDQPRRADQPPQAPLARATGPASDLWNPMPGASWADDPQSLETHLRSAGVNVGAISTSQDPVTGHRTVHFAGTDAFFHSAADADVVYAAGQMVRIEATFSRPPALAEVAAAYERRFGPPASKSIASTADQTSTIRWTARGVAVTVTEVQGVLSLSFSRQLQE